MLEVIIVDDELDAIDVLETLIRKHGKAKIKKSFSKVREFLKYIETETADVIFLDINMPYMTGIEVVKIINEKMNSKIIFTTSHSEYAIEAFDLRAYHYFLKPVNRQKLNNTLDTLCLESAKKDVKIKFYNRFELVKDNKVITFRTKKAVELLAFFIYKGRCSKDSVLDNVFHGIKVDKAINNVYSTFYYIRKALKDNNIDIEISYKNNYYEVNLSDATIDYKELNNLDVNRHINDSNIKQYYNAFYNYRGDFLFMSGYQWSIAESMFLREKYEKLYDKLARYYKEDKQKRFNIYITAFKIDQTDEKFAYNLIDELIQQKKHEEAIQIFNKYKEECEKLSLDISKNIGALMDDKLGKKENKNLVVR